MKKISAMKKERLLWWIFSLLRSVLSWKLLVDSIGCFSMRRRRRNDNTSEILCLIISICHYNNQSASCLSYVSIVSFSKLAFLSVIHIYVCENVQSWRLHIHTPWSYFFWETYEPSFSFPQVLILRLVASFPLFYIANTHTQKERRTYKKKKKKKKSSKREKKIVEKAKEFYQNSTIW